MTVRACTIIARNYLPAARVLAESFAAHHPGSRLTVLLVDDRARELDVSVEPFDALRLDEIGIEPNEILRMAAIYDVMELSTATKPWLLQTMLDAGDGPVLYLDPDIAVYAPLDDLAERAARDSIVLTPHVTAPLPRDDKTTSESEILASGMFNLGFIAVSDSAGPFLRFWKERLRRECVVDPQRMRFVDQRWVDFAPGAFGAAIVTDPGCNVAYWNLGQRRVRLVGGGYEVDGRPLRFFHFSGYRPDAPWLLSRHQGERPRVLLSEQPDLAALCDAYRAALLAAGYEADGARPYGFGALASGISYDPVMRSLYREALLASERASARAVPGPSAEEPPNPFAPGGDFAFVDWLNSVPPERPGGQVSRYLMAVYESRVDLQAVFSEVDGDGFAHFAEWSLHEVGQQRLDGRLAVPAGVAAEAARALVGPGASRVDVGRPGIRVAGYLRAETGVGELGRLAALVVERAGIACTTFVDTNTVSRQAHPVAPGVDLGLDVNLVCVNADELPNFARRVGPRFFEGRYTIGLWAWELEEFPERFFGAFAYVDEVWAISDFARAAISRISPKPVFAFPLPILEVAPGVAERAAFGLGDGFTFLFCFDMMSVVERKNPFGLLEAFTRAFAPGEGPTLVVKAVNNVLRQPELERLKWTAAKRPDVVVVDRYLTRQENLALVATCDCYVSLHRSEGFGLTMAEAMALGKPVVATAYSANLEFMSSDTAYLVPYTAGEVPVANDPYPHRARWAEPDLDAAARLMRDVYEHPGEAAALGARARADVLAHHGVDSRAPFVLERFAHAEEILARRRSHGRPRRTRSRRAFGRDR
ncbi:MAG TPA: glycosyltransferase [Acidimicrobiales bacterium]|nr:glycosyltransferase [Acidimicrobiales bacterium]